MKMLFTAMVAAVLLGQSAMAEYACDATYRKLNKHIPCTQFISAFTGEPHKYIRYAAANPNVFSVYLKRYANQHALNAAELEMLEANNFSNGFVQAMRLDRRQVAVYTNTDRTMIGKLTIFSACVFYNEYVVDQTDCADYLQRMAAPMYRELRAYKEICGTMTASTCVREHYENAIRP